MGFLDFINPFSSNDSNNKEVKVNEQEVEKEEEESFSCEECGKEFNTEAGVNIHSGQVHKEEDEE